MSDQIPNNVAGDSRDEGFRGGPNISHPLPLDDDLVHKIAALGFHPFILVRLGNVSGDGRFLVCATQNDLPDFLPALRASVAWRSMLLRGIVHAASAGDIVESSKLLLSWIENAQGAPPDVAFIGLPAGARLPTYYNYPIFQVEPANGPSDPSDRLSLLGKLLDAYAQADGNNASRIAIVEAMALALVMAVRKQAAQAEAHLRRGLLQQPNSQHLTSALNSLRQDGLSGLGTPPPKFDYDSGPAPTLDEEIAFKVRAVGFHPFFLVRIPTAEGDGRFLVCATQNEIGGFSDTVRALGGRTKLLGGIIRAMSPGGILEGVDLIHQWIHQAPEERSETAYFGLSPGMDLPAYYGYPIVEIDSLNAPSTPSQRISLLCAMFDAYAHAKGNDGSRVTILEALALALARCAEQMGLAEAGRFVSRALVLHPESRHLKAAMHALELRIAGEYIPINSRKYIGLVPPKDFVKVQYTVSPVAGAQNRLAVVYLARAMDGPDSFRNFLASYRRHPAGIDHDVLIIFKGFESEDHLEYAKRIFATLKYTGVVVNDTGFDIGAYLKTTRLTNYDYYCFFNTYAEVVSDNWLAHLSRHASMPGVGLVGAMGSYESLFNSWRTIYKVLVLCNDLKVRYDSRVAHYYEYIIKDHCAHWLKGGAPYAPESDSLSWRSKISRLYWDLMFEIKWDRQISWRMKRRVPSYLSLNLQEFEDFIPFPNPHIRSNGFLVSRSVLHAYKSPRIVTKYDACRFESGPESLTEFVRKRGTAAIVVGRDGTGYDVGEWAASNTFRLGQQENLLVTDNQTRHFDQMAPVTQFTHRRLTWGDYLGPAPRDYPKLGFGFEVDRSITGSSVARSMKEPVTGETAAR